MCSNAVSSDNSHCFVLFCSVEPLCCQSLRADFVMFTFTLPSSHGVQLLQKNASSIVIMFRHQTRYLNHTLEFSASGDTVFKNAEADEERERVCVCRYMSNSD
jgi:hypothetical protein